MTKSSDTANDPTKQPKRLDRQVLKLVNVTIDSHLSEIDKKLVKLDDQMDLLDERMNLLNENLIWLRRELGNKVNDIKYGLLRKIPNKDTTND